MFKKSLFLINIINNFLFSSQFFIHPLPALSSHSRFSLSMNILKSSHSIPTVSCTQCLSNNKKSSRKKVKVTSSLRCDSFNPPTPSYSMAISFSQRPDHTFNKSTSSIIFDAIREKFILFWGFRFFYTLPPPSHLSPRSLLISLACESIKMLSFSIRKS